MQLPSFTLEAGADLTHHVVRACYAGPQLAGGRDRALLERHLHVLNDALLDAPAQVVRRSAAELAEVGTLPAEFALEAHTPTVVVVHALTGDARALGPRGFWEPLGRSGAPLDVEHTRVLCINLLGSCYGTSGPGDADFPRYEDDRKSGTRQPGKGAFQVPVARMPATVTTMDQARSILLALDALGVQRVDLLTGGSLGGMVALALAALDPLRFRVVAPIAATDCASPWLQAWNHIGRAAIWADEARGFELARQLGMLSYRAERGFERTQGVVRGQQVCSDQPQPIQTWLEHQGTKLAQRFDVESYLCLLGAMDLHDLSRLPDYESALAKTILIGVSINTDQLFTPQQTHAYVQRVGALGGHVGHEELISDFGHDAFLIEWSELTRVLQHAFALVAETT